MFCATDQQTNVPSLQTNDPFHIPVTADTFRPSVHIQVCLKHAQLQNDTATGCVGGTVECNSIRTRAALRHSETPDRHNGYMWEYEKRHVLVLQEMDTVENEPWFGLMGDLVTGGPGHRITWSLEGLVTGGPVQWRAWSLEGLVTGGTGHWMTWSMEGLVTGGPGHWKA